MSARIHHIEGRPGPHPQVVLADERCHHLLVMSGRYSDLLLAMVGLHFVHGFLALFPPVQQGWVRLTTDTSRPQVEDPHSRTEPTQDL